MAKQGKYIQLLSNESAKSQGWQFACLVLVGLCVYLGFMLKTTISELPIRLIPYNLHTSKGVVEVSKNGEANQTYIELIASGDAQLFTEFKPQTAVLKTRRLLNRFEPALYAANKAPLLEQAKSNQEEKITQSYTVERIKARDGNEVLIYGFLKRWEGAKLISEGYIHFAITYRYLDGIPYIYDYTPFKNEREVVNELNSKKEENQ